MRTIEGNLPNPRAQSLEDLGIILGNGIIDIKPFRDWVGSPSWQHTIFSMRLCNAGEVLDMAEASSFFSEGVSRQQVSKLEILSRSITSIDSRAIITQEELNKYNTDYKTEFSSPREWISVYLKNLESVVVDRLDAVYGALQLKQGRQLRGEYQCSVTGNTFTKSNIPEGSLYLQYSLQEIITPDGMLAEPDYKELFDIVEVNKSTTVSEETPSTISVEPQKEEGTFEERRLKMEESHK